MKALKVIGIIALVVLIIWISSRLMKKASGCGCGGACGRHGAGLSPNDTEITMTDVGDGQEYKVSFQGEDQTKGSGKTKFLARATNFANELLDRCENPEQPVHIRLYAKGSDGSEQLVAEKTVAVKDLQYFNS